MPFWHAFGVVDERFVDRWAGRLRREVPEAVAVLLGGSHARGDARGDAGPHSDVDFDVLVPEGPRDEGLAWFEVAGERLVCVSAWVRDVGAWLAAQEQPQEWAFFLPCADPLRLCWVADGSWRERLGRAQVVYPPGEPEIGHFEGEAGKVASAWAGGDELGLRLAAQDLARSVASLVQPLNPGPPVRSRREALRAVLDFGVVPAGYRDDMLTCLALAGRYASPGEVHAAAGRLARGVLALLDAHASAFAALLSPQAARCLHDGNLRRYIEQALGDPASGPARPD